jgi:hypothetical protein
MNKYADLSQIELNKEFVLACGNGDLKSVKYLLTSPQLQSHADLHYDFEAGLKIAGKNGHLAIVKYLLLSPELPEHSDIRAFDEKNGDYSTFTDIICEYGQLKILKFLFTIPEIKKRLWVYRITMFMYAYQGTQKAIIDYFIFDFLIHKEDKIDEILQSFRNPPFKNIVESMFRFRDACYDRNYELVKNFIFEKNIELTPPMKKFIRSKKEVKRLFDIRELHKKLQSEISDNKSNKINKKISKI